MYNLSACAFHVVMTSDKLICDLTPKKTGLIYIKYTYSYVTGFAKTRHNDARTKIQFIA